MKAVIQRVSSASVRIAGEVTGEIGPGLLVLLGVQAGDTEADARWLAAKIVGRRPVATGQFGAMMEVALVNAGPVTLVIDSRLRE